ncbi:MAG TPA: ArsA-related P-loop ATPase [Acidimicrobiales bacterium]|nr:ArsA-related P-loop ATPase [Acidimicrobiales bacterium]
MTPRKDVPATTAPTTTETTVEALLAAKEIAVVCGPGGVGKTTVAAAAAAMAACHQGGKVLVVTVDPARRLATALGLRLGRGVERVRPSAFAGARVTPRGELWAEMLDTKQSWDALVTQHAPDAATAKRILGNPLYKDISGRFVQSHDYIAVERLYELHAEAKYDLIVVDTPPTRNAVDFLLAPERIIDFFSSRLLRLLTVPYRRRFVDVASRPFYYVADRVLGSQFVQDLAEFFILFQTLSDGFVQRAQEVERLLADRRTTFIVVSTLEDMPVREAEAFMDLLPAKGFHLGAIVLNRVLPTYLLDAGSSERAGRLTASADELARSLCSGAVEGADPALVARVLKEVGTNFNNIGVVARREASQRSELSRLAAVVARAPELEDDVHDLTGVLELGRHIWSPEA